MPGALVLGGDYRALGVVRSLGRKGIPAWVLRAPDDHRLAALSRYSDRSLTWPAHGDADRLDNVVDLARRQGLQGWVLFPTADATAAFVARQHRALGETFRLTTPAWEVFRWAYDKRCTAQLAASLGIDHPWTQPVPDRGAAARYRGPFPVILKPATKPWLNRPAAKAWRVEDAEDLLRGFDQAARETEPGTLVLQELIPGERHAQYSFAALCDDGRAVACLTAERVRQHPPDFGRSSSLVETVEVPAVEAHGRRILAELGVTGPAEVEFKRDPRDGSYRLLDINLRVWGWHTIARRVGLDFPYLAWRLAVGLPVPRLSAPAGLRWLRLTTDVAAGAREIRSGTLTASEYLRSVLGGHEAAIAAVDDPLPSLAEVPLFAMSAGVRRLLARGQGTGAAPEADAVPAPGAGGTDGRLGWAGG